MSRSTRKDKLKALEQENKRLKSQVNKLLKELHRVDYAWQSEAEEVRETKLEEKWTCFKCGRGVLRIKKIVTPSKTKYRRCCDNCDNKTRLQDWHEEVKGI